MGILDNITWLQVVIMLLIFAALPALALLLIGWAQRLLGVRKEDVAKWAQDAAVKRVDGFIIRVISAFRGNVEQPTDKAAGDVAERTSSDSIT